MPTDPNLTLAFFDGASYDPEEDQARLQAQFSAVRDLMTDGRWRTLAEIAAAVHAPEASISARLRDLRKPRFGGWVVERERVRGGNGLHRYRVRRALHDR